MASGMQAARMRPDQPTDKAMACRPAGRGVVTPLRRPAGPAGDPGPLRAWSTRSDVRHQHRRWWPVQPFSAGKDRVRDVNRRAMARRPGL